MNEKCLTENIKKYQLIKSKTINPIKKI